MEVRHLTKPRCLDYYEGPSDQADHTIKLVHQFMSAIGRKCSIVNLDPANDKTSYPCALDVRDLVTLDEIMEQEELGPNGGTLYAIEELDTNFEWLEKGLKELGGQLCCYFEIASTRLWWTSAEIGVERGLRSI